jgi:hypothetical protein
MMKNLYVTELNLVPRIKKEINDTFKSDEKYVEVKEAEVAMTKL